MRPLRTGTRLLALLLFVLSACKIVPARHPATAHKPVAAQTQPVAAKWNYLSAGSLDPIALLPAPPDRASPQARAFEASLTGAMKRIAGPTLRDNAESDEIDSVWQFASVMGPPFAPERCPKIAAFIDRATADANRIKNLAKDQYARQRPPTATEAGETYAAAQANAARSEDWSYPSGHATRAALWACLLGAIDPAKQQDLLSDAWFMCLSRIVRGVHFPSDVTAGFILGQAIADAILDSPQAAADLAAARAEWKAIETAGK